jgi:hypothetical protein
MHEHVILGPFRGDLLPGERFDRLQVEGTVLVGERYGFPRGAGAGGAADPVDVILWILRKIVVDDVGNLLDVETA